MKKMIIAACLLFTCACIPETRTEKVYKDPYNNMLTLKPHVFTYNPENYIRIDMTITEICKTYFMTEDNTESFYYTVYAMDESENIYCICDDLECSDISGYEHMLVLGNNVMLVYEKGKPNCTGIIYPLNDWNN